ncbi:hypothetical protein A3Q36_02920 [Geobacillus stearothermophilus]|nr:hypothetical protein A3Q36_02920 [Geobacillus stearothermophilus]
MKKRKRRTAPFRREGGPPFLWAATNKRAMRHPEVGVGLLLCRSFRRAVSHRRDARRMAVSR